MRVLHVIGSMNPLYGGPCQGIRNLDMASRQLGIHREVLCLDEPNAEFLGNDPFPIHAIGPPHSTWWYNSKLIPWLIQHGESFDVIVINGLWLYISFAVWKAIRHLEHQSVLTKNKVPKFFIMPHGMLDPYFQRAPSRKFKAFRNWIYWKLIENRVVNDAHGLLFTCEAELQLAHKPFRPYHPKREINIGYGIQLPPLPSSIMNKAFLEKCPETNSQPYLLFLSRINYKKGIDLLIKAYKNLLKTKIELPNLVIAGPELESLYGQRLQKMVSENPLLRKSIFFCGMLTGDAKWGAIYGCEAFILPSHQENFGIAVAEALACSRAVLISNQVNIWREIEDGGGGLVFEDSIYGVQGAIKQWLNLTSNQRKSMEFRAKEVYESNFAIDPVANRFLEAISS